MSLRLDELLLTRVRETARRSGRAVNRYIVDVLAAATDPALAGDEVEQVRLRLALAGLLEQDPSPELQAPAAAAEVAAARREAGKGTPLSDLVAGGRH